MRIGIDCRTILNPNEDKGAGVAHYTMHLVEGLIAANPEDEFVLFFDHRTQGAMDRFLRPNTTVRYLKLSGYKKYLPVIYSQLLVGGFLNQEGLDVFHGPANVQPLGFNGKTVLTVHDLAIYKFPEFFPKQVFSTKVVVPESLKRANKIIAVSQSTKKDLLERGVPEEKIEVIYEGVDFEKFYPTEDRQAVFSEMARKYKIKRPFMLFLGTLEPRKNLINLLEALWMVKSRNPEIIKEYQLVLAGGRGWLYQSIFDEIQNRDLSDNVVLPGYVKGEDVPKLMQAAEFFVYPSFYEGFGLPVLEAMACGTPVICSNSSSLPEVGGEVPHYVDPHDAEGLADAIEQFLTDKYARERQQKLGPEQAKKFTWGDAVRQTREVYKKI